MGSVPASEDELRHQCGSYRAAVTAVMALGRALWSLSFPVGGNGVVRSRAGRRHYFFSEDDVSQQFNFPNPCVLELLLGDLRTAPAGEGRRPGQLAVPRPLLQPIAMVREKLRGLKPDHDLRYFAMADIRRHYRCLPTAETARCLQVLAEAVNSLLRLGPHSTHGTPSLRRSLNYADDLFPVLKEALSYSPRSDEEIGREIDLFVECCRAVNYLQADEHSGFISFRTQEIDAAFLLSHLFGLTTAIPGFDNLFGGGGLMLIDHVVPHTADTISGRTVLTRGRFGTGKSLLSLQVAVEVARKGGAVWVIPFEQSPEECLYSLESICYLPNDHSMVVAKGNAATARILEDRFLQEGISDQGLLIILGTTKDSLDGFSLAIPDILPRLEPFPIRLIVVDPVNAIRREKDPSSLRSETLDLLTAVKDSGTNIWLIAEEQADKENETFYQQNIADTVIGLSFEPVSGYSQREFEITKSRLQREQRGKHPYSIIPGKGIAIFPSPAAVHARIRPRSVRTPDFPVKFGLQALDEILGPNAICAGDVIVLQGASGCFKTELGLGFLLGGDGNLGANDPRREAESLLVAARDSEPTLRQMLDRHVIHDEDCVRKSRNDVHVAELARGFIRPGYILQYIEDAFLRARLRNHTIDRLMVDNVAHWEMSCPFIQAEPTFGDVLVDLVSPNNSRFLKTRKASYGTNTLSRRCLNDQRRLSLG